VRLRRRIRGDDGTILLLSIGFCVVALLLVYAVTSASAVFLARRDLASAVDGTALAAAQAVDADEYYTGTSGVDLPLDDVDVRRAVDDYVRRNLPSDRTQRISGAVDASGHAVTVRGERDVHLPLFGTVTVTAHATAVNRRRNGG
jgi:hypothetical protein